MEQIKMNITCPKCSKVYSVLPRAYNRKIKDEKYGLLCKSCRAKVQWEEMTEEQKQEMINKGHEANRIKIQSMNEADKAKLSEIRSANASNYWQNLSSEERAKISSDRSTIRRDIISRLSDKDRIAIGKKVSATKKAKKANMTEAERMAAFNKHSEASKNAWANMDESAKQKAIENLRSGNDEYWKNISAEDLANRSKLMSERNHSFWNNPAYTEEQKKLLQLMQDGKRLYLEQMTPEEMEAYRQKLSETMKNLWSNMSEDRKKSISDKHKAQWDNLSDEEKDAIVQKIKDSQESKSDEEKSEIIRKRLESWNSKTPAEIEAINQKKRDTRSKMSDDDKLKLSERMSQKGKDWWNSLSDEEKASVTDRLTHMYENIPDERKDELKQNQRDRYAKLSDEDKAEITARVRSYWDGLDDDKFHEIMKKIHTQANGNNALHKKFESYFHDSYISNEFAFAPETITHNEDYHSWDYGIYDQENDLVMVVDLDGAYYHADNCDYDGLHSREEYDERRSLSVPDGVKICIINELNFSRCFENMIKMLMLDYDEFVENLFHQCRFIGFPYIEYSDKELLRSYESLRKMRCDDKYHTDASLNSRLGDRIIQHFHHSIWHAHIKGDLSPYEAWKDDELLRKVIRNRIVYQNTLNPNKILQGFNVAKVATKVSVFSASRAKLLIHKYLSDYDTIFDPFSGFSGRMLGTVSLGKKYIGQDINEIHIQESNNIIEFLKRYKVNIDASIECKDILQSYGEYPCLFTCPPYGDKEEWIDGILSEIHSCDDWIDICLERFKCGRYLFVVDDTKKYGEYVIDTILNKSHFGRNNEIVILIPGKEI